MTTYVRDDGLRCFEVPLVGDAESVRAMAAKLLTSELQWVWESARRDGSRTRPLTQLTQATAGDLVGNFSDRDEDGFGRDIQIYGTDKGGILTPELLKDAVASFVHHLHGPIRVVIVRSGDAQAEHIFATSSSGPEVNGFLNAVGIAGFTTGEERPYKLLRTARLEVLFDV